MLPFVSIPPPPLLTPTPLPLCKNVTPHFSEVNYLPFCLPTYLRTHTHTHTHFLLLSPFLLLTPSFLILLLLLLLLLLLESHEARRLGANDEVYGVESVV